MVEDKEHDAHEHDASPGVALVDIEHLEDWQGDEDNLDILLVEDKEHDDIWAEPQSPGSGFTPAATSSACCSAQAVRLRLPDGVFKGASSSLSSNSSQKVFRIKR